MQRARPPVATTVVFWPSSASMRSIMPSSSRAAPRMLPLFMQSTVLVPMAWGGASSEMAGSSDVWDASADRDSCTPGMMAPPRNAPSPSSTVTVVAVPMSMRIRGGSYTSSAPTAATSRSLASVAGSSRRTVRSERMPGPTTMGSTPVSIFTASDRERVTWGTTEEIMAPSKASGAIWPNSSRRLMVTAYSAPVVSRLVAMRHR